MRRSIRLVGVALTCLVVSLRCGAVGLAAGQDLEASQLTLAQYQQELNRIDRRLKALVEHPEGAQPLRASIPDEWRIQTSSGRFDIENDDLQDKLGQYADSPGKRGEILPELEFRVEGQLEEATRFEQPADASAESKLKSILRGNEYRNVAKTQSPLEKLKDLVLGWLIRLFSKLFRAGAAHPRVSKILLWSIIGLITLGFVVWLYFLLRRTTRDEYQYPQNDGALVPSYKPWQQWLGEARACADRGDWREAIHLAYWSGISYLESSGAWKPDRARTPREYLRLLPDLSARREPLQALTGRFELTWYARQDASPADFDFTLAQLQKIGCQ